jgi:hypothetical protein
MGSNSSKEVVVNDNDSKPKNESTLLPIGTLRLNDDNDDDKGEPKTTMNNRNNTICVNCSKETQMDVPSSNVQTNVVCVESYQNVQRCMDRNHGQISSCTMEWKAFQQCHDNNNTNKS